ncbi:pyridoxamine 5'-phosphate oxidase [Enemella evansiae]|uniref:MSMEG_1061 family FMN-dependent PPOX-type flavoprotein n=1 Tax=Enemella evansiae TaxID=2016499 RepID=UPI000B95FCB9|nr:MSMEG_1061 family FMN-dependent PPOX-type flavoprotein [Enemella evansiae]OYO12422.1 pyridoxamine 5'-phosphate oxidase [Enemella evansiae]
MSEQRITSPAELREHYPTQPAGNSLAKEVDHVTELYARWLGSSPFCVVATVRDGGVDCSPRGDGPGFVRVRDPHTLEIPDRRGNNRLDTLQNLIADDRIGLIFLVPGVEECVRVRGRAYLSVEPEVLDSHAVKGKRPASVIVVQVERVYFQCARAMKRSRLWDAESQVPRGVLPSAGMFTEEAGGFTEAEREAYDDALEARQLGSLY